MSAAEVFFIAWGTIHNDIYIPLSDNFGELGTDSDDLRLSILPVLVALLILFSDPSSEYWASSSSKRFCCSGNVILSSMSAIT